MKPERFEIAGPNEEYRAEARARARRNAKTAQWESLSMVILRHPGRDNAWVAEKIGMPRSKLERLLATPEFQEVLEARRTKVLGPLVAEAQVANATLHMTAINRAVERVDDMDDRVLVEAINATGKNLGLQRPAAPNIAVNTQFVVKWMDDERPGTDIDPVPPA